MRAVLVKHQPLARHDVEHAVGDRTRHVAAIWTATVAGPAAFILRPEAMQHERERSTRPRTTLGVAPLLARVGAVGRTPRQRQQVVVKRSGLMLPTRSISPIIVAVVAVGPRPVGNLLGGNLACTQDKNDQGDGEICRPGILRNKTLHGKTPDSCMREEHMPQMRTKQELNGHPHGIAAELAAIGACR